jgi:ParB-like chromosome segregation protein Spo0J
VHVWVWRPILGWLRGDERLMVRRETGMLRPQRIPLVITSGFGALALTSVLYSEYHATKIPGRLAPFFQMVHDLMLAEFRRDVVAVERLNRGIVAVYPAALNMALTELGQLTDASRIRQPQEWANHAISIVPAGTASSAKRGDGTGPSTPKDSGPAVDVRSLPAHPAAASFPLMSHDELNELAESLRTNGLQAPIVIADIDSQWVVLDGRNRLRACALAGVVPTWRVWTGSDAIAFIISANIERRHLTPGQRALIAAELAETKVADARARKGVRTDLRAKLPAGPAAVPSPAAKFGRVRDGVSEQLQVSPRLTQMAMTVQRRAPAEVTEAVRAGVVAVSDAARISRLPIGEQVAALAQVSAGQFKTLAQAVARPDAPAQASRSGLPRSPAIAGHAATAHKGRAAPEGPTLRELLAHPPGKWELVTKLSQADGGWVARKLYRDVETTFVIAGAKLFVGRSDELSQTNQRR